ncbi:MAG: GntR family transcriptional regulator [Bryobacteraceae bacterium]
MLFKLNPSAGQPLYLQVMQQVRYAIETGVLQDGDLMPGIRTLAEELVVSHNTIAKAYTELQHEGWLELRQGLGAFICTRQLTNKPERVRVAQKRAREFVALLRADGFSNDEIQRFLEAEILFPTEAVRK